MTTHQPFRAAFQSALRREGFKPAKTLVDRRAKKFEKLYQAPDGQRYALRDAVVAAVRR